MKIHIIGTTGMLGNYVSKFLSKKGYDIKCYNRNVINALTFKYDSNLLTVGENDVIINCVGLLKPRIRNEEEAKLINKEFAESLDLIATRTGCRLVNFSSDCVFSGERGSYTERDVCDAVDIYGLTKTHESLQSTVLRLSFIGEEMNNKIGLLEFALQNKGKSITGYTNCLWNGVTGLEIAKIIERLITNDGISFWSGIRHVFSGRVVSKYDILSCINEVYNLKLDIIPIEATEISGTLIKNTLDRSLDTIYNKIEVPSLEEMLYEQKNYIYEN
jgi:dTDP-4-dehydrorhamnose reductase